MKRFALVPTEPISKIRKCDIEKPFNDSFVQKWT